MNELKKLSDQEQQEASFDAFLAKLEKDRTEHHRKVETILRIFTVLAILVPFSPAIYYCIKWLLK